ncbi:MAG: hypothetical protein AAFY46_07160 [Planctomycetota bacterium]
MATDERDPFYVGYLPTPAPHRRFAKAAFLAVLLVAAGTGALVAWLMDDPGDAVWASQPSTITGTLRLEPVTFIDTDDGPVLLVEIGKFGARDLSSLGDGSPVTATGLLLSRGEQRMLELTSDDTAVAQTDGTPPQSPRGQQTFPITVTGEIIDTKCYLGAMKPGQGTTHAACGRLCIRGGIPAGFVGVLGGEPLWAVIDPGDREVISEELLNAVGDQVTIEAVFITVNGLDVLYNVRLVEPHAGSN